MVSPGSLSTASLSPQSASFEFLIFSMMGQVKKGSSDPWKMVEVARGFMKARLLELEATAQ